MNEMDDYINIDLSDFTYGFKYEIEYFSEYLKFNEGKVDEWKRQLNEKLEVDKKKAPGCEKGLEEIYRIDDLKLPSYFYHSTIVTLYSILESKLNEICRIIKQKTELVVDLKDMAGTNIIEKARKYLIFFAEVDFEIKQNDWKRITDFQKLRNIIIHHNFLSEEVINEDKKISKAIELFNSIEYLESSNEFFVKDLSIPEEFLLLIKNFILELVKQINERKFPIHKKVDKPKDFDDLPF